jgi:hypothetical protein
VVGRRTRRAKERLQERGTRRTNVGQTSAPHLPAKTGACAPKPRRFIACSSSECTPMAAGSCRARLARSTPIRGSVDLGGADEDDGGVGPSRLSRFRRSQPPASTAIQGMSDDFKPNAPRFHRPAAVRHKEGSIHVVGRVGAGSQAHFVGWSLSAAPDAASCPPTWERTRHD